MLMMNNKENNDVISIKIMDKDLIAMNDAIVKIKNTLKIV